MDIPFSQYLQEMATDGTHGNDLTLCTSSSTYNVDITLVSSLEGKDHLEMNPTEFPTFGRIVLGDFREGYGERDVVLDEEWQGNQDRSSTSSSNEEVEINVETFVNLMIIIHTHHYPWQKVIIIAMLELNIFPVLKKMSRMMKKEVIQVS